VIDAELRWRLARRFHRNDQLIVQGALIIQDFFKDLGIRAPDLKAPARWSARIYYLVGLLEDQLWQLSTWWAELQIRWVIRRGGGRL
jgi:hypothetical protein